jgi:hypothetical protein
MIGHETHLQNLAHLDILGPGGRMLLELEIRIEGRQHEDDCLRELGILRLLEEWNRCGWIEQGPRFLPRFETLRLQEVVHLTELEQLASDSLRQIGTL